MCQRASSLLRQLAASLLRNRAEGQLFSLLESSWNLDDSIFAQLLDGVVDINARNKEGETFLHLLCMRQHWASDVSLVPLMKLLMERGADVSARTFEGRTPLHHAVEKGTAHPISHRVHLQLIRLLVVDHHADVNARDNQGVTPLILAARDMYGIQYDTLETLLELNADVNAQDETGQNTLNHVIGRDGEGSATFAHRSLDHFICLMVRRGLNLSLADQEGKTPLHKAARYGLTSAFAVLLDHQADTNVSDHAGNSPLHLVLMGSWNHSHRLTCIRLLHRHNADMNHRNKVRITGITPLQGVVEGRYIDERTEVLQLLIDCGADVLATDEQGRTLLHIVAETGTVDVARLLLVNFLPDVDVKDNAGNTPLHNALTRSLNAPVTRMFLRPEMVKFFLDNNADVNASNDLGNTPLNIVASDFYFHDLEQRTHSVLTREIVQLLAGRGADPFAANKKGGMPIFFFMMKGQWNEVRVLLKHCKSTSVNVQDQFGDTPLLIGVRRGDVDCVTLLLERGADMHIPNFYTTSPFLTACEVGSIDMIYRLIRFSPHHLRPQLRRP